MPTDKLSNLSDSLISPARDCFVVVPSDSVELSLVTKALYVGTGGHVALQANDSAGAVTFRNLPSGAILDVRVRKVLATGTTATDIVGLA